MTRPLTPELLGALRGSDWAPVLLAELTYNTFILRVHSGIGDLEHGGNTYSGVGEFGSVSGISENETLRPGSLTLTLSGLADHPDAVAQDLRSVIEAQLGRGTAVISLGALNAEGELLAAPSVLMRGYAEPPEFMLGDRAECKISVESDIRTFSNIADRRIDPFLFRELREGDTGADWVASFVDLQQGLRWGPDIRPQQSSYAAAVQDGG